MADHLSPAAHKSSAAQGISKVVPAHPPCTQNADQLHPIVIWQMSLKTHHCGKRLIVRVLSSPVRSSTGPCLAAPVEDEQEHPAWLELYYQPSEKVVPAERILRYGSCYLIKEPFLWISPDGHNRLTLRVDHPSDIIQLPQGHEFFPVIWRKSDGFVGSSHEARMKGNDAVGNMKWAEAEDLYTTAAEKAETTEDARLAYLNRSLANLRLGRPATALADAIKSAGTDNPVRTEKSFFREAVALYELAKYDQSLDRLQELKAAYPSSGAADPMIIRVQARLKEQQTGVYDFGDMYKQAKATPPLVDCATYNLPVEIKYFPDKRRGVFTTKKVLAGELLICEKAFGYIYGGNDHRSSRGMTLRDSREALRTQILQRLLHNVEDARLFGGLRHGDYDAVSVYEADGKSVVDAFLVAIVVSLTGYRAPRTELSRFREMAFGPQDSVQLDSVTLGVWAFTSNINHSCINNAKVSFIGDMQIVRATRDLDAGVELLVPYEDPKYFETYDQAQERVGHWGFTCGCALCLDRKATPERVLLKRKAMYEELEQLIPRVSGETCIVSAQLVLDRINGTFPAAPKEPGSVRMEPWVISVLLSRSFTVAGRYPEAIEVTLQGLESMGFVISANPRKGVTKVDKPELCIKQWGVVDGLSVIAFKSLHLAYKTVAPENAPAARGYMEVAYSICVGEKETFPDTYPEIA